ncbi:MAG TPA: pyridoxamine 5'-phosphate oxidase family protein [Bacteroidia bacterium]|jgi:general stress protein 26|nr:pyridoxamine 5'-phosphate oxidase family protein [Bacteroidia bacterium]
MKKASLKTIAEKMKNLDLCMLVTQDGHHAYHARPMSNNGKVEYDGNSWFFTLKDSAKVKHIENNHKVSLIFQSKDNLFIECYGNAKIIDDKKTMEDKWVDSIKQWMPKGLETPGICLLKVEAKRIHFWHKEEEAEYQS